MTAVLVIEDDANIWHVVELALTGAGMAVTHAATGADGVAAISETAADVILLDLDLPDARGVDLLPSLTEQAPVIILTGHDAEETIVRAFELGADDYVTKPFSARVLVARVEAAARRTVRRSAAVIQHDGLAIDPVHRRATIDGVPVDLTRRELDVLAYLAARPGAVVTRDELLAEVWCSSAEWQSPATVTEHVRRIRSKLGDDRWIANVRGIGYRFEVPERPAS